MKNKKHLGQNWLKNRQILDHIADLALQNLSPDLLCLEIGPGLGTLTSSLLRRFNQVLAIEFDPDLAAHLPASFPGKNLEVKHQDFLQFDLEPIKRPYIVAGNIPYYITSPIIRKLLTSSHPPRRIVLLVQKEVAERIAETKNHTFLSLFVQNFATPTLGPVVPKTEFTPPPKVDSQILILEPHPPFVSDQTLSLIKTGFSSPRKKLIKNLPCPKDQLLDALQAIGHHPDCRPSDLQLLDWKKLAKIIHKR